MRPPGTQKKNAIAVLILWGSGLARWVPQYADVPQGGRLWWGSAVCMFLKKEERIWCTGAGTPAAVFLTLCFAYSLMELGPDEEYVCYSECTFCVCRDVRLQADVFVLHKAAMNATCCL